MKDLNLKPLLFFTICLILSLPSNLLGQSGGLFKKRGKASNDGGYEIWICAHNTKVLKFSIALATITHQYPCNLHIGITMPNGDTYFSPVVVTTPPPNININVLGGDPDYTTSNFVPESYASFEIPKNFEKNCDGDEVYSISFTIDLYCKYADGNYTSIVPCESNLFNNILPSDLNDECSLETEYTLRYTCCDPKVEIDGPSGRNNTSDLGETNATIYALDGRLIHSFMLDKNSNIGNEIQQLNVSSGIYIVTLRNGSSITTKKYFKN